MDVFKSIIKGLKEALEHQEKDGPSSSRLRA